ncbi:MAG: winged helix-turn-helix domain-containing protein, partial [Chloroflexota bacterium]
MVNAAYMLLKEHGTAQYYKDLTTEALQRGLISTQGLTPEASLLSAINRENARRSQQGEIPRFEQMDDGVYGLVEWRPTGIEQKIEEINQLTRQKLHNYLMAMPPKLFEQLIGMLLNDLGFETVDVVG